MQHNETIDNTFLLISMSICKFSDVFSKCPSQENENISSVIGSRKYIQYLRFILLYLDSFVSTLTQETRIL